MNCRQAQDHLFADRGALENDQRAALDAHVATCPACQRINANLTAALTDWRRAAELAPVPDSEREWHAVRRKIRGGAEAGTTGTLAPARRRFLPWLALPLGAAAAIATALYVASDPTQAPAGGTHGIVARADFVEAPGAAQTMVYVDEKSGWLVVYAKDNQL